MDFSKIEINGKLLGVLNFNLMIPIEEAQLQLIDTTIFRRDRNSIKYYKKLCSQELEWCQENSEVMCNKANVLYKKYISNELFSGRNRCLNFPKLETACKNYNAKIKNVSKWTPFAFLRFQRLAAFYGVLTSSLPGFRQFAGRFGEQVCKIRHFTGNSLWLVKNFLLLFYPLYHAAVRFVDIVPIIIDSYSQYFTRISF